MRLLPRRLRRLLLRCTCGARSRGRPRGSRTRELFRNERLRVLDTRLAPRSRRRWCHAVPTVRWQAVGDHLPTPTPDFFEAGSSVTVSNGSAHEERREIVFEILQSPRYTEAEVTHLLNRPSWPTEVGTKLMFENRLMRLWDFRSSHGMHKHQLHLHTLDNAFVILGAAKLNVYKPEQGAAQPAQPTLVKSIVAEDGDVVWNTVAHGGFEADGITPVSPQCLHSVENCAEDEFREYLIELK